MFASICYYKLIFGIKDPKYNFNLIQNMLRSMTPLGINESMCDPLNLLMDLIETNTIIRSNQIP